MSINELSTKEEKLAYWFSALARFSDTISVAVIITSSPFYALITLATGALGREVSGYYKLRMTPKEPK